VQKMVHPGRDFANYRLKANQVPRAQCTVVQSAGDVIMYIVDEMMGVADLPGSVKASDCRSL
jgi:hypothetical protein